MAVTAVIGHGRSPEGKRWGQKIDRCQTVVRMWDWQWQNRNDYGRKYDYGLFEIGGGITEKFVALNQRQPAAGWVASFLFRMTSEIRLPAKTEIIDQWRWTEIGRAEFDGIGASGRLQFTRGTLAALWAIERSQAEDEVVLVGFDSVVAGKALPVDEGFSPVYRAQPTTFHFNGYVENAVRYGNHDFSVERPVMELLAARHRVKLNFAQETW